MEEKQKNKAAVSLGRRGGKARMAKLTKEQKSELGRKAGEASALKRWPAKVKLQVEPEVTE